jgi:hypothetical protein
LEESYPPCIGNKEIPQRLLSEQISIRIPPHAIFPYAFKAGIRARRI